MGRLKERVTTSSAKGTSNRQEMPIDLPSGKYGQIEPSTVLLRRAESPPNPVLPKQIVAKPPPKTMRENTAMSSSLTGAGRAGKPGCLSGSRGSKYLGQVLAGRPHGKGEYFAQAVQPGKPMKLVYSGDFSRGARQGMGTVYYNNGEVYTGAWLNNKRTGYGRLTYTDGCAYEGMWRSDRRHGVGTYYGINGDVFVGTFVDDKRHGLGTTYMPSRGKKYVAEYVSGSLQCGEFYDLADNDVEVPPTDSLKDTINSSTLQQAVTGRIPAHMPALGLSQPSKILAKEFVDLRKQRNDLKSPADGTLPADSISLLRHAFVLIAGGDDTACFIMPHQFQELMVLAGLDPAAPAVIKLMKFLQNKAAARATDNLPSSSSRNSTSATAGTLYLDDLMHVLCFFREKPLDMQEMEHIQLTKAHGAAKAAMAAAAVSKSAPGSAQRVSPAVRTAPTAAADTAGDLAADEPHVDEEWEHDESAEADMAAEEVMAEQEETGAQGAGAELDMLERHIAQHRGQSAGGMQSVTCSQQQVQDAEPPAEEVSAAGPHTADMPAQPLAEHLPAAVEISLLPAGTAVDDESMLEQHSGTAVVEAAIDDEQTAAMPADHETVSAANQEAAADDEDTAAGDTAAVQEVSAVGDCSGTIDDTAHDADLTQSLETADPGTAAGESGNV